LIRLRAAAASDVGRNPGRTNNEDRFLAKDGLWAVADGVGGHAGGEVASGMAVDLLDQQFDPSGEAPLTVVIRQANRAIWDRARSDPDLRGMATTITAIARVDADGEDADRLIVANVGDSRTYLLRAGELSQLTVDHSQVEEMVRDGVISREEAGRHPYRHIVTRVLGMEPEVDVDTWDMAPVPGDRFLLCSDGLIDEVPDSDIAEILRQETGTQAAVDRLVRTALDNGGSDNVTVVVLDAVDSTDGQDPGVTAIPPPRAAPPPAAEREPRDVTGVVPVVRHQRRLTLRVVLFLAALVLVIAGACAAVVWYARASYYVGLQGNEVTIFKGRPGGVLWFRPTLAQTTGVTTAQILPSALPSLQSGMTEPSLSAAKNYVNNLLDAYQAANPSPTTTTTEPLGSSTSTTGTKP
jgi:serine/threonine protein phosphatase PrpC